MEYELSRATIEKTRHVICYRDRFYEDVPDRVRYNGPWQLIRTGNVDDLMPEYRLALARVGYVYVEAHPVGFSVTA